MKLKKKFSAQPSGVTIKNTQPSKKGIRCPECVVPGQLVGVCVFAVQAPLAKGGGIKMAGISVGHKQVKEQWEKQEKSIVCMNCSEKFVYDGKLKKLPEVT